MVLALPKPTPPRQQPLIAAPHGDPRLLAPGWAGYLADDELAFIRSELYRDPARARLWGFRPSQKTCADEAIGRVAMDGDPEGTAHNRQLARPRRMATLPPEGDSA